MIAVIFEVWPADGRKNDYLDIAARLRSDLVAIDGFISVERFQSLSDPDKLLSLSFWRDEDAVTRWRNHSAHRRSQHERAKGELKTLMPEDAKEAMGHGIRAKRSKSGAISFDLLEMEGAYAPVQ